MDNRLIFRYQLVGAMEGRSGESSASEWIEVASG